MRRVWTVLFVLVMGLGIAVAIGQADPGRTTDDGPTQVGWEKTDHTVRWYAPINRCPVFYYGDGTGKWSKRTQGQAFKDCEAWRQQNTPNAIAKCRIGFGRRRPVCK